MNFEDTSIIGYFTSHHEKKKTVHCEVRQKEAICVRCLTVENFTRNSPSKNNNKNNPHPNSKDFQ